MLYLPGIFGIFTDGISIYRKANNLGGSTKKYLYWANEFFRQSPVFSLCLPAPPLFRFGRLPLPRRKGHPLAGLCRHVGFLRPHFLLRLLCRLAPKGQSGRRLDAGRPLCSSADRSIYHERDLGGGRLYQRYGGIHQQLRPGLGPGSLGLCPQPDRRGSLLCPHHAQAPLPDHARPALPALRQAHDGPAVCAGPGGRDLLDGRHPHGPGHHLRYCPGPGSRTGYHPVGGG